MIKTGDKKQTISDKAKESIIVYLTDNPEGKTVEIAEYLNLSPSRTRNYLKELVEEGVVIAEEQVTKEGPIDLKVNDLASKQLWTDMEKSISGWL